MAIQTQKQIMLAEICPPVRFGLIFGQKKRKTPQSTHSCARMHSELDLLMEIVTDYGMLRGYLIFLSVDVYY